VNRQGVFQVMWADKANVNAGAIDIDSAEFAAQFGGTDAEDSQVAPEGEFDAPEDFDAGANVRVQRTDKPNPKNAPRGSSSKAKQTAKEKAAAQKAKEKANAKKKADAEKAKAERAAAREAAKAEKAAAKAAGPDITGLVAAKAAGANAKFVNVPLDALDGIDGGDPVDKSFVESVRLMGRILLPIVVREYTAEDGEIRYNILDGKRRAQAARALEFAKVPATVETREDANDYIIGLQANFQRSNNIMEEHRMIRALLDGGFSLAQIAKATGMKISQVSRANNVDRLLPELQAAVESGQMMSHAAAFASRLSPEIQAGLVDTLNREGKVTAEDVKIATRSKQADAVREAADTAAATGQDMFATPDAGDADTTPVAPTTRTDKVVAIVRHCREALALAESLSSKSDDERDAVVFLSQIIENLTTNA